jgi:hypothetical protein
MSLSVQELSDKVWQSVTQDAYSASDIGRLISIALSLEEERNSLLIENDQLKVHNKYLTDAVESAGKKIQQLEQFEQTSHLVQYAEENVSGNSSEN